MDTGDDCVKEDEISKALKSFEQAYGRIKERVISLKRRCNANQVFLQEKQVKIEVGKREVEKVKQQVNRDTAELRK